MNIITPSYEVMLIAPEPHGCLRHLERIGRTAYKSEDKTTATSAPEFVRKILKSDRLDQLSRTLCERLQNVTSIDEAVVKMVDDVEKMLTDPPHESVIEHSLITVKFVVDRGVSHELVRHRLCAFTQESTRYCNYAKGKFGEEIALIYPSFWQEPGDDKKRMAWRQAMQVLEDAYLALIRLGAKPQEARSVLPNSLKTEIVVSANFREWRHIMRMRTSRLAHPQMREVMVPLLREFQGTPGICVLFEDIVEHSDGRDR